MRERFIAPRVVDHFHFFGLAGKRSFQSRKKPIHRNVDLDNFEFLPHRRSVADFIGRLRAGDKNVAKPNLPRQPSLAYFALPELGRALNAMICSVTLFLV